MPIQSQVTSLTPADLTSVDTLRDAVVRETAGNRLFTGLLLDLPFSRKGSAGIRATAKGYGARWNGKHWTLEGVAASPRSSAATDAALEWFRAGGHIKAILTRTYAPWVWDGAKHYPVALLVPYAQRTAARHHGARWDTRYKRWTLPAADITQVRVDYFNSEGWIEGYYNPSNGAILNGGAVNTAPAVHPNAPAPAWAGHPTRPAATSDDPNAGTGVRIVHIDMLADPITARTVPNWVDAHKELRAAEEYTNSGNVLRASEWDRTSMLMGGYSKRYYLGHSSGVVIMFQDCAYIPQGAAAGPSIKAPASPDRLFVAIVSTAWDTKGITRPLPTGSMEHWGNVVWRAIGDRPYYLITARAARVAYEALAGKGFVPTDLWPGPAASPTAPPVATRASVGAALGATAG